MPNFSPENPKSLLKPPREGNGKNLIMSMFGCEPDSFVPATSVYSEEFIKHVQRYCLLENRNYFKVPEDANAFICNQE